MTEPKLVICYIGQDVEDYINMSLDSIKNVADAIVFVDGGSKDKTLDILYEYEFGITHPNTKPWKNRTLIPRKYEHDNKGGNGRARNCYLDFIKKNYPGWWALVLDPDEIVTNIKDIKSIIKQVEEKYPNKNIVLNPHMRHLITYINYEDSTLPIHSCPGRFFKITEDLYYKEIEHPVLQCNIPHFRGPIFLFTIWHIAYIPYVFSIRKRYLNQLKKSDMHKEIELDDWYFAHITGTFAKKEFPLKELPDEVKKYFLFDRYDKYNYYQNRRDLEIKHFLMTKEFVSIIDKQPKEISILDIGAGMGLYGYAMQHLGVKDYIGIEKSEYAIDNRNYKEEVKVIQGDVTKELDLKKKFDLVLCLDILEHLAYDDLDKALKNIIKHCGNKVIFCIPYKNDPDCHNDSTHIIKEDKSWWLKKLKKYFYINDVPTDWQFEYKLLIGDLKDEKNIS